MVSGHLVTFYPSERNSTYLPLSHGPMLKLDPPGRISEQVNYRRAECVLS